MAIPSGSGQDRCILEDGNQQVHLNVSGLLYTTSLNTLKAVPGSRLADTFDSSWRLRRTASGEVFIDRDGEAFGVILQYLRAERESGLFTVPHLLEDKLARLKAEARFYGLSALHDIIHAGPPQNQMHEGTARYLAQAARSHQVQLMSRASMDAWAASWMCPEEFLPAASTGSHLTTALAMGSTEAKWFADSLQSSGPWVAWKSWLNA
ncbi:hypothetical protein WJX84_009543 [Apatococcus fuscideae]|uniref:Potassium channel tetramerisation-type BTB domain-containing protein n=1 Tax=Apatococcus fuscideae TaxID=2026836 RepID=A0AAW1S8Q0_9CHLO